MSVNKKNPAIQKYSGVDAFTALVATLIVLLSIFAAFVYVITPAPSAQATLSSEIR